MVFTFVAIGLAAIVAGLLVLTLTRGRSDDEPPAAYDLRVYREQLREVDRDLARGVIAEDEAARIRTEVSRRVLEADRELRAQKAAGHAPRLLSAAVALVVLALLIGGAWIVYDVTGSPGYADQPLKARIAEAAQIHASRPHQADAEAQAAPPAGMQAPDPEYLDLVKKLRAVVAERKDDVQGFLLLARNEAALGNFKPAYEAQARAIELKGSQATADDYATQADMMVLAAGGYVSPEAEAVLEQALNRNPQNGTALYYWGLMQIQTGRPDIAFRVWRQLLSVSKPDDPWVEPVRRDMQDLAWYAGDDKYQLPPLAGAGAAGGGPRGPSAADMQAAADMTPEQRQQMIQNMVGRLSDRLESEGGKPQEWAQLINALGVLGDTETASQKWQAAQKAFADQPEALATVRQAAQAAGVAQ